MQGNHAIVIGASIAGLLAARVLADHFDRITIIDRDQLPQEPEFRAGVPQARHIHVLLVRGQRLALVAADLDTANVADVFTAFAENGENLCREREMLSGRSLDAGESAQSALKFLTQGQDRFFFDLHRFNSDLGHAAFDAGKDANAPLVKALIVGVRARLALAQAAHLAQSDRHIVERGEVLDEVASNEPGCAGDRHSPGHIAFS